MLIPMNTAFTLCQLSFSEIIYWRTKSKAAKIIDTPKNQNQISDNSKGISSIFPINKFNGPKKQSVNDSKDDVSKNEAILSLYCLWFCNLYTCLKRISLSLNNHIC